jgi:hypothetical protein
MFMYQGSEDAHGPHSIRLELATELQMYVNWY